MTGKEDPECRPTQHCSGFRLRKKWPQGDMAGHKPVGTPSGARRCSADGKIALGLQSQTSVRQAARDRSFSSSELCHNQTDPLPDHAVNLSSLDKLTTCRFRRAVRESAVARGAYSSPAAGCGAAILPNAQAAAVGPPYP